MSLTQQQVADAYSDTATKTVTSGPMLVVRLYDRLANDLELAKTYIGEGDFENVDNCLQHAQKIVIVLRAGLRPEGFEGGQNLRRLYNTLLDLLMNANLFKDGRVISKCQEIVAPLQGAWAQAVAIELERQGGDGAL